jgi:predicted porin
MKKSLLAVAVLGAFAGTAMAAEVTLYGVVDTGLEYVYSKTKETGKDNVKSHQFDMMSGRQAGSRWGLKGVEELGNGYSVGFVLEDGIKSDTGVDDGVMFDREAVLFIDGGFGRLYAGRQGSMMQGTGSVAKLGMLNAFGTSYGDYAANASGTLVAATKRDNTLTYVTPKFAGFQVYAQYSMGGEGIENKSNRKTKWVESEAGSGEYYKTTDVSADRYAALAATYSNGPLNLLLGVDRIFYGHDAGKSVDDSLTVTFGGNYDFGVVKVFGGAQYFDEVSLSAAGSQDAKLYKYNGGKYDVEAGKLAGKGAAYKAKGFGLTLSASAPVAGGTLLAGVGYMDADEADSMKDFDFKFKRVRGTVGYSYPLSKRTNVYAAVGAGQDKTELKDSTKKVNYATAFFGLRHNF